MAAYFGEYLEKFRAKMDPHVVALIEAGRIFDIKPAGMLSLDVARIEAGLLLIDVDFNSSKKALDAAQRYSPF